MPTIFYSWQSDAPDEINRNFIRDALTEAVESLNRADRPKIDDAERNEIRIDQDTQDVPGSPDIAKTILEKIDACDVFISDVSLVYCKKGSAEKDAGRLAPNPNVMLEYGYALKAHDTDKIVPVINTHYGSVEKLPFDMRHRLVRASYNLAKDADVETQRNVQSKLAADFAESIAVILAKKFVSAKKTKSSFKHAQDFDSGATFVEPNKAFSMSVEGRDDVEIRFPASEVSKMFLRLMPSEEVPPITRTDSLQILKSDPLEAFGWKHQGKQTYCGECRNADGVGRVALHPRGNELIGSISQIMMTREIWGVETYILNSQYHPANSPTNQYPWFLDSTVCTVFKESLEQYIHLAVSKLELSPPFVAIAGLVNLKDHRMVLFGREPRQIHDSEIIHKITIEDPARPAVELLAPFFTDLYDSVGWQWSPLDS